MLQSPLRLVQDIQLAPLVFSMLHVSLFKTMNMLGKTVRALGRRGVSLPDFGLIFGPAIRFCQGHAHAILRGGILAHPDPCGCSPGCTVLETA